MTTPATKTADGLTFDVALYSSLTDTAAQVRRVTWDELAEAVGTHAERVQRDGLLFSAVTFKGGLATRANDNVERVDLAVFEVDHEEPHWGLLDGLEYVAYTTHGHAGAGGDHPRENCPHWRIVLLLARAVLRADPTDPNQLDTDRPRPDGIACESNRAPFDRVPVPR